MRRFFCDKNLKGSSHVILKGAEARHLHVVSCIRSGDDIVLFDGSQREYLGRVQKTGPYEVLIDIFTSRKIPVPAVEVVLAQATLKNDKMKYVIQKSSEVGIAGIIPVLTERSISRPAKSDLEHHRRKWERIALGSAKQSGRGSVMVVHSIATFDDLMKLVPAYDLSLLLAPGVGAGHIRQTLRTRLKAKKILLVVGPEGGFSPQEVKMATLSGLCITSLGSLTLRSDSVALAAGAMIMYQYGDAP